MIEAASLSDLRISGVTAALNGGTVEYWSGTMPSDTLTTPTGVLLGTVTLQDPSFNAPVNGSALIVPTAISNATVAGTLSFLRWRAFDSETLFLMRVSLSADLSAEILVSTVNIEIGTPLALSGISVT